MTMEPVADAAPPGPTQGAKAKKLDLLPKKVREYLGILGELFNFLRHPREVVRRSLNGERDLPSPVPLIVGTIAICLIAIGLQFKPFAGLAEHLRSELYTNEQRGAMNRALRERPKEAAHFELFEVNWLIPVSFTAKFGSHVVRVAFEPSCGAGLTFRESSYVPLHMPQLAVIKVGCSEYRLYNATPKKMARPASATALVVAFSLITALSIGLAFYIAGYRPPIADQIAVASMWYCSTMLIFIICSFIVGAVWSLSIGVGASPLNKYLILFAAAVYLVSGFVALRAFFSAYSELYAVRKLRFAVFLIVAFILTGLVGPLIMVPILYMINEFGPVIDQLI